MQWVNNQLIANDGSALSPQDRGWLLGEGVFDTLLIKNGTPLDWQVHLDRLMQAARYFAIPAPYSAQCLRAGVEQLLQTHPDYQSDAVCRITASSGSGGRGLVANHPTTPTWVIQLSARPPTPSAISLIDSPITRNQTSPTAFYKTTNYLDAIMAKKQALARGADDAILYNSQQHIACCCTANLFIKKQNTLYTPPIADGVLNGITRHKILTHPDLNAREKTLYKKDLENADAIFISNSIISVVPIATINGNPVAQDNTFLQHLKETIT